MSVLAHGSRDFFIWFRMVSLPCNSCDCLLNSFLKRGAILRDYRGQISAFGHAVTHLGVEVASTLVAEKRYSGWFYPFVTFFKMTQIQYLILTLTVYLGIILLIALATIAIQFLLGNSYFSFAILILLNMALFLGAYYSNVTFMNVILRLLNPTNLYITSGAWFMENDITLSFAGNEFWIIGVTGIWMILCVKIARNFKLYDRNVSSIHKNIKKDRCTKNEFH